MTLAASNNPAGAVLRRLAVGGSAVALAAVLFGAHPAGASTAGHGNSAQVTAHQHQSSQAKQAAERAAKQAAERAKHAVEAKRAPAEKAKAEQAARKQAQQAAAAAGQASHPAKAGHPAGKAVTTKAPTAAAKAQVAAEKAQAAAAAKAQAAVTKALRKAGLLTGNSGNGDNGNQPATPASTGKSGVPTSHQQVASAASNKPSSTELASTAARQANAVGSVFVTNSALAGSRAVPVRQPVQHPAAVKQVKPRTDLVAPPVKVLQVQTPIQLVQAGLSLGAGPMVLLGLVVIGGLATVIAGTRRRHSGQHS